MKNLISVFYIFILTLILSCNLSKKTNTSNSTKHMCPVNVRIDTIFRVREKIIRDTIYKDKIVEKIVEKEVIKVLEKIVYVPIHDTLYITKTQHDTLVKIDSTKVTELTKVIDSLKFSNNTFTSEVLKLNKTKDYLSLWLFLALILGSGVAYYFYKQIKQN